MVELEGTEVTRCEQCGYRFGISNESNSSAITKKSVATPELTTLLSKLRQLKTKKLSHETSTIHTSRIKTKKNITTLKKSKKSIWFTVVKWYFILVFSMGILSQCYRS